MLQSVAWIFLVACPSGKVDIDGEAGAGGDPTPPELTDSAPPEDTGPPPPIDFDGDGFDDNEDCDDEDASVYPDAPEHCDGVDEDCDGAIDEDAVDMPTWYLDGDGDGYGTPGAPVQACEAPSNAVDNEEDCDDSDAEVHPAAEEICGDDQDNDCDGGPGDCVVQGILTTADADATVYGTRPDHFCGAIASKAGDVDADGLDDLILGLPSDDRGTVGAGIAGVFYGPLHGDVPIDDADLLIVGASIEDGVGGAVTLAGYINDDLYADVAIGAPGANAGGTGEDAGAVFVVFGGSSGEISTREAETQYQGENAGDHAGGQVISAEDIDGDGRTELAIAAEDASEVHTSAGRIYLVSPGTLGTFPLVEADTRLDGTSDQERAGHMMRPAGDLNNDGTADLLVGAPYYNDPVAGDRAGRLYIVWGGSDLTDGSLETAGVSISGAEADAFVGLAMTTVGDMNDDGQPDLVVSSMNADHGGTNTGAVYVLYGPFDANRYTTEADLTIPGEFAGDMTGRTLANAGDFNRDGLADFMVGSNGNDYGGNNAGAAYVALSPFVDGVNLASPGAIVYGVDEDDWAGAHMGSLGDMDGDGAADLFVSAPNHKGKPPESVENAGGLHLFYGNGAM